MSSPPASEVAQDDSEDDNSVDIPDYEHFKCSKCGKDTASCWSIDILEAVDYWSIEEQKLLWPVLARVCNQSKVFEWPEFTTTELESMDRVEAALGRSPNAFIGDSLLNSSILLEMGILDGDPRATFAAVRKGGVDAPDVPESARGKLRHQLLVVELQRLLPDARRSLSQIYADIDPFQLSSLVQNEVGEEFAFYEINPSTTKWWNSFQRDMLIACTFWILCHRDASNNRLVEQRDLAFENLREMIDDEISVDEGQFAAALDANISQDLEKGNLPQFFPLRSAFAARRTARKT